MINMLSIHELKMRCKFDLIEKIETILLTAEIEHHILAKSGINPDKLVAFNMQKERVVSSLANLLSELRVNIYAVDQAQAMFQFTTKTLALNNLRNAFCIPPIEILIGLPLTDESVARLTAKPSKL